MDGAFDVPDSTDWLNTPLKEFADLENALHCQICKEFYDTPMITSCNHTFCSKCIRTSLSSDGKCPACRTSDQASKLRNNWALQEVVSTFLAARPTALGVARQAQEEAEAPKRVGKRKRAAVLDSDDIAEEGPPGRTTRSKSRRIAASQESQPEPIEIADSEDDEEEEYKPEPPQPDDGLVECPLGCGKRMKEVDVFTHLDRCDDEKKQASRSKSRTPMNGFGSLKPSNQKARPQDRINELNYSMMKDQAFKKKLKEIGIPDWGTRQLMIQRHKEWVNIWNANCDSTHPRTKRDLLHDLDVWERTQGGRAPNANGLSSTIMKKDFDGEAYSRRHQDEFSRLIADAKRKKGNPASQTNSAKAEEDASEPPVLNGESNLVESPQPAQVKPYENSPEAVNSIREKVEALNQGKSIVPAFNEGFKNLIADDSSANLLMKSPSANPSTNAQDFARPQSSRHQLSSITPPDIGGKEPEGQPQKPILSLSRESSKDEHTTNEHTGSPCDLATHLTDSSSPTKKVPMFAVPAQPVRDIDGGGGSFAAP